MNSEEVTKEKFVCRPNMGVRKLTTLVRNHPRIYRDVRFRNSRLVVDGLNLLNLLYFSSGLDQNHGGDYAAFEILIERFISALRVCGVSPYVVMDGGSDPSNRKLETMNKRVKERIQKVRRAAVSGEQLNILPQLAKLVFQQTLVRLEVPLAQCYTEADHEIAALADEWQCPVLSNDSDFYVFWLKGGFLPISYFQWEEVKEMQYIPCKKYNTSSFCTFFNIQPQLLPAFAALAGNDYVDLQTADSTRNWAQVASDLEGLLHWVKGFQQPQDAFEAAVGMMGDMNPKKRGELLQSLFLGMEDYKIHPSSLKEFFINGIAPPFIRGKENVVPDWTWLALTQARWSPIFLNVLVVGRWNASNPVEHKDMPSSLLVSRPIRQVVYALLLGSQSLRGVDEYHRIGLELSSTFVQPVLREVTQQLDLSSLCKAESSQCLQVLLETLGVPQDSLQRLPSDLHLQVAATCYWLKKATPPPDLRLLKALLLLWSNEVLMSQRTAENQRRHHELDLDVTYSFNQWQACLMNSIELNQLLDWPLSEPRVSRAYGGTMAHYLVHMIRSGEMKTLLKHPFLNVKLYNTLQDVTCQFYPQEVERPSNPKSYPWNQGSVETGLKLLSLQYEADPMEERSSIRAETDALLCDSVTVKTRHKTNDQITQWKKTQLVRKQEHRAQM